MRCNPSAPPARLKTPLPPLSSSLLIYLPDVSLKQSHPFVWPVFPHLWLCFFFFVHHHLGDYSNQVINYTARQYFYAAQSQVQQSRRWQPGWVMLLLRPSVTCFNSSCNCFRLIVTYWALTESRDTLGHYACNKYKHPLTADSLTRLYLACPAS